jgi:hypothetical protein
VITLIRSASNIPAAQRRSISTESFRSCAVRELLSGFLRFDCCNRIQNQVCGCGYIACSQKLLIVVMMLGWLIGCASSVEPPRYNVRTASFWSESAAIASKPEEHIP